MTNNFDFLFTFLFIFSTLNVLRNTLKFIVTLLQSDPQRLILGNGELILLGVSISYALTYIIYK